MQGGNALRGRLQGECLPADGKRILVDPVEWFTIPDPSTALAARQTGSIDWYESLRIDLLPIVNRNKDLVVTTLDKAGHPAIPRFNHLHPPFNDVRMRRAIIAAIQQAPYPEVAVGNRDHSEQCKSFFPRSTPMSSATGPNAIAGGGSAKRGSSDG